MATHMGRGVVLTFCRSPMAHRRFLKHPLLSMESVSSVFGSPFRHFTGVKCEERPLRAWASISLHLGGPLAFVVLDPFADLASEASRLNLILHK